MIDFAVGVLAIVESLPESRCGKHIAGQLIRSGTSPAANYSEAQSAESRKDFIHKMTVALKELRETLTWLKVIDRRLLCEPGRMAPILNECNQLISIFVKSLETARGNSPES
jgi:four helix bundle protein